MSPNIARPLTLRTSPSDYATFNQKKIFFYIKYQAAFGKRKTAKGFHFKLSLLSRGGGGGGGGGVFGKHLQKLIKKIRPKFQMTQTSNYLYWKHVFVEVICWE